MTYEYIILRHILANIYKIQQSTHNDDNTCPLHIFEQHSGNGSYWRIPPRNTTNTNKTRERSSNSPQHHYRQTQSQLTACPSTDLPQEDHLSDSSDYGDVEGYSAEITSDGEGYRSQTVIFKSRFLCVATKIGKEEALQAGDQGGYHSRLRRRHGHIRAKIHNHGTPRLHILCAALVLVFLMHYLEYTRQPYARGNDRNEGQDRRAVPPAPGTLGSSSPVNATEDPGLSNASSHEVRFRYICVSLKH